MPEPEFRKDLRGVPRDGIPWDRKLAALDHASIPDTDQSGHVSRGF